MDLSQKFVGVVHNLQKFLTTRISFYDFFRHHKNIVIFTFFRVFHKVALISPLKDVHEDYLVSLEESTKT